MRLFRIHWLRLLLEWLDPPPPPLPPPPVYVPAIDPVLTVAREFVKDQQQWADRSGESKRHQVYAALIKAFPEESRRRLSRVIEQAVELEWPT